MKPPNTLSYELIDPFTGHATFTCKWDKKDEQYPQLFALDRTGKVLATCGEGSLLRLWDMASGKCLAAIKHKQMQIISLFFSPGGNILFVGSVRSAPVLYAVPSGKLLAELPYGASMSVVFSPDGQLLATGDARSIKLWSIPDEWRKRDK